MAKSKITVETYKGKLSELMVNPDNPRRITEEKFTRLKKSVKNSEWMTEVREIVVDENNLILGGNQRARAMIAEGKTETMIKKVSGLTEKQKREFIIKDNVGYGENDWDILANEWDTQELDEFDLGIIEKKITEQNNGAIEFSEEIDIESNYVVLKFNTDIDFINIQTLLGLKSTYSKRANGKPWGKGIGRVVDGITAIELLKNG